MKPRTDAHGPARTFRRLGLEVTQRCNCRCIHCFARTPSDDAEEMPRDVAMAIVREGRQAGFDHLHLTGGEPLLYPGIFALLDEAAAQGYTSILLNTNGLLLNPRMGRRLAQYPGLTLTVSLEGTPALHDRFRGAGTQPEVARGLENALAAGNAVVVFTMAFKSLLPELPRFADVLLSRYPGVGGLTLIRLLGPGIGRSGLNHEYLSPLEFLDLARTSALINLYGLRTTVLNEPLINVVSAKLRLPAIPPSAPLCRDGQLMIRANRRISLAHTDGHHLGTYRPGGLKKIRAAAAYRKAVAPANRGCTTCTHQKSCRDGGLIRPADWPMKRTSPVFFCQSVLDIIAG